MFSLGSFRESGYGRNRELYGPETSLLLPKMMLHRSPRGGLIAREKLIERFDKFAAGQWHDLIASSNRFAKEAATVWRRRARRVQCNQEKKRVSRDFNLVQMKELSAGKHALEGAELTAGSGLTLKELRKLVSRPREPHPKYTLSTRAGCDFIAHMLQSLTELDPEVTVTLIDGTSAYDSLSRQAMVEGLVRVPGGGAVLPVAHLLRAEPSAYVWKTRRERCTQPIKVKGERREIPLMPFLFSSG